MTIKTDPDLPLIACKPYPLPLKHHTFVKEEMKTLLEARHSDRSVNPYATPIIVVPRKGKPGTPLAETKALVIDYQELNKQISKVQTMQVKLKGSLALIETAKIDLIWSKWKGANYFTIIDNKSGYHHISIHQDSRLKAAFTCPYGKSQWKRVAFGVQMAPNVFLKCMFKLFLKYLDDFLVFWMDVGYTVKLKKNT